MTDNDPLAEQDSGHNLKTASQNTRTELPGHPVAGIYSSLLRPGVFPTDLYDGFEVLDWCL
jgi:hypothetical protein